QQYDHHDDEHHGAGGFGPEDLGEAFDDAQAQAGDDRAQDRTHAADDHHGEDDDDQVRAHQRRDLQDGGGQHPGKARQPDAEAEGERDHQRHVHAECFDQLGVFGAGAQQRAQAGLLDDEPGQQAGQDRGHDDPGAIDRQEHETQVHAALQQGGRTVGLAGYAVEAAEQAFDEQCQAKGEQQAVERIELVEAAQQQAFEDDAEQAHDHGGHEQHDPVVQPQVLQAHPGDEGPQHVERAVGEVDDVEQAEDDGQPQREHGVERAVDQAE